MTLKEYVNLHGFNVEDLNDEEMKEVQEELEQYNREDGMLLGSILDDKPFTESTYLGGK